MSEHLGDLGSVDPGQRQVACGDGLSERQRTAEVDHGPRQAGDPESAQLHHVGLRQRHTVDLYPTTRSAAAMSISGQVHPRQLLTPHRKLVQGGSGGMTDYGCRVALRHSRLQQLQVGHPRVQLPVEGLGVRAPPEVHQLAHSNHPGQLARTETICRQIATQPNA
jgi:hypothetical protein